MLIKEANKAKIENIIKTAGGKASVRTIRYGYIVESLENLEKFLGIRKKDMIGITADVDYHAQDFPNAYKHTPVSTHFTVVRKTSGWDLVSAERDTTRRHNHTFHVTLTDAAKQAIIESKMTF